MADAAPQPVAGILEAVLIHACTVHADQSCGLDCPERKREDLGVIARFDRRPGEDLG